MFRGLSVALADAMNAWLAPAPAPAPQNRFIGNRTDGTYVHDGIGRVYNYVVPTSAPIFLVEASKADLMGYNATHRALKSAYDAWIHENGTPREKSVVLRASDWTGHFTVTANTDVDHTLVLRLSVPADVVARESPLVLGPEMR